MQKFHGLLRPNSSERPDCVCGAVMVLRVTTRVDAAEEAELRTYSCEACGHEFKLTVWADAAQQPAGPAGL